MIIVTADSGN